MVATSVAYNKHPLRIGSCSSSETGLFHGLIDEVTLWNRVLTPSEVASLYRAGSAGMCRTQLSELHNPSAAPTP
ncbi:LamG-like jellyroll fold domain-containing protein [Archangium sp.]|uniref:LamG-like jellyroll fold domain-containing protein n=1 Tax=Archangium sp. TaxID=1872627 RepID=UPI002D6476AB|nr:LamG-like jellyroll fold domain-containing protein [Archangium sp.]HYO60010.1 LamG-like jellyroll fold domain-containing protein [Archangium sp.]